MPPIRVLLIDDHAMFRAGLGVLLQSGPDPLQVASAASLGEVLHGDRPAPDVILLDIRLQGLNGLEGIASLQRRWPEVPIVMLSSDASPETVQAAMDRGAAAFVSKEKTAENVADVIRQVLARARRCGIGSEPAAQAAESPARLTPRQNEVLDLLCRGLTNKAIGNKLGLSENTVRWHVQAVLAFLDVANRSEAAFAARQRGLIG